MCISRSLAQFCVCTLVSTQHFPFSVQHASHLEQHDTGSRLFALDANVPHHQVHQQGHLKKLRDTANYEKAAERRLTLVVLLPKANLYAASRHDHVEEGRGTPEALLNRWRCGEQLFHVLTAPTRSPPDGIEARFPCEMRCGAVSLAGCAHFTEEGQRKGGGCQDFMWDCWREYPFCTVSCTCG